MKHKPSETPHRESGIKLKIKHETLINFRKLSNKNGKFHSAIYFTITPTEASTFMNWPLHKTRSIHLLFNSKKAFKITHSGVFHNPFLMGGKYPLPVLLNQSLRNFLP